MGMNEGFEDTHRYDDIMELPHHVSQTHPQMTLADRAAQFSPFQALTGYADAVKETARLTEEWVDLDEGCREELDRKLALLKEHLDERPEVTVIFFEPDDRKEGGIYRSVSGRVKKIDTLGHKMILMDGTSLPMEYIVQVKGGILDSVTVQPED